MNQNYTTTFTVDQSLPEVFDAINTVRDCWSQAIDGSTDTPYVNKEKPIMNQRAQALVQRFNTANAEMISYIEGCSEGDLDRVTAGEGWRVRVTAHHLAASHEPVAGLAQLLGSGQPLPPLTLEIFHQGNAQHATEYATVSKQTILDALQSGGAKAGAVVSGLSDEALDRAGYFTLFNGDVTAQGIIENILIAHISSHLESIKAAVGK